MATTPNSSEVLLDLAQTTKLLESERKARQKAEAELSSLQQLVKKKLNTDDSAHRHAAMTGLGKIISPEAIGLLNRASCGVALHDTQTGVFVECNEAGIELFGATTESQVIGKHPGQLSPPRQPDGLTSIESAAKRLANASKYGSEQFEWVLRRIDGGDFPVQVSLTGVEVDGTAMVLAVWIDTSERDQARRALYESEGRYRRLVEGVQRDFLIYSSTPEGILTYISPSAEDVLGYPPEAFIGKNWRDFVDNDASLATTEEYEAKAIKGLQPAPNVVEARHANGEVKFIEVSARPVLDEAGEVVGVEGIGKDVTESKQAEATLIAAKEELDRRVRDRTAELLHRLEFEELLVGLSTGFINLPVSEIDDGLSLALKRIGQFTSVDRCFIYSFDNQRHEASLTHEWTARGVPSVKQQMQRVPMARFSWEIEQLVKNRHLHFPDATNLPMQAKGLRELYPRLNVKSAVNVALMRGAELIGLLGFVSIHETKMWGEEDIELAQVLAEVLVNTLDRHRAERALRESEERYRVIIEDQTELIVRWQPDGTLTFANGAVSRFHGVPVEQLIGSNIFEGIHDEDRQQVRDKVRALSPEHSFAVDEHRTHRLDGSIAWMQWIDRAIFSDEGELVEYQSTGRDVTPLRRAHELLEERLEFERMILSLSMRFINMPIDAIERELTEALSRVCQFTKVDRSYMYLADKNFKTAHMRYCWSAPGAPPIAPEARQVVIGDHPWAVEILSRGEPIHVPSLDDMPAESAKFRGELEAMGVKSYINVPLRANEKLIGYLGFSKFHEEREWSEEDIALLRVVGEVFVNAIKRQDAEVALLKSEERLRLTIEGVEEGMFDWNIQSGEVYVSDYLLQSMGLADDSNQQRFEWWSERLHPDDRQEALTILQDHLVGSTPIFDARYRVRVSSGEFRWARSRARVIERSEDGRPLRMVGVQRDVTPQIEAKEQQQQLELKLAHLARVATMGETVAGIAHEVNQPLHAASAFSAAARGAMRSATPDGVTRAIELSEKASAQISRAGDIIRQLREFTRPRPAEFSEVDLNNLVYEAADFVLKFRKTHPVQVIYRLDENLPILNLDRVQVQQVVVNLVQNAYDALNQSPVDEPRIMITTHRDKDEALVTVADNANTIPPENPEEFFEAFFTTKSSGMGIGLSLCRTIAEAHGGRIVAALGEERGMSFTVRLPVSRSASQ